MCHIMTKMTLSHQWKFGLYSKKKKTSKHGVSLPERLMRRSIDPIYAEPTIIHQDYF